MLKQRVPTAGPTAPVRRRRGSRLAVIAVVALLAVVPAWSIGAALTVPGSDSVAARLAEWGRDHGLGGVITWLEGMQYQLSPPPVGGTPAGGIPRPSPAPTTSASPAASLPAPAPMSPLAGGPALPGEGQWQTVSSVRGLRRFGWPICDPTPGTPPSCRA